MSEQPVKVYLLPLGCAKNMVNAEQMLALLRDAGMEIVAEPAGADVAIVNTCGFIDSAKSEAIEAILGLAELKKQGRLRAIVAAGCMTERYRGEVRRELPEVDAVLGTGSYGDIVAAVRAALGGGEREFFAPKESCALTGSRVLLTPAYSAYLRIAEGCDNRCAYCVIPSIRGPYRSVPMEDLVAEARRLAAGGARELLVIAQDISRYGTDLYGRRCLRDLLAQLEQIEGIRWLRLHYLYPDELDDELLDYCAASDKVLHYFDLPIQHIDDDLLRAMNRRGDGALIRNRIDAVRARMPDAVIRTSLISGFPGETEKQHRALCAFLEEYRLERAGIFAYSREEGSTAAVMPHQVPEKTKQRRVAELYAIQQRVMETHSRDQIGRRLTVLCCGRDEDGRMYGRSYMDSPDIDGLVYFEDANAREGDFISVDIIDAEGCDLYGRAIQEETRV
jgi:ribosomal protein S12 methylthiotransferase